MTPDERELRRALAARSGEPAPAFRARMSAALAEGRPARDLRPALGLVATLLLAMVTVAVFMLARHGNAPVPSHPQPGPPFVSPSQPVVSPSPPAATPTPAVPPVIAASPTIRVSPIVLPTTAQFAAPSSRVVWVLVSSVELFRSSDQGSTWEQRPLPSDPGLLDGMTFVDDRQGWLLSTGSAVGDCQAQAAVIWHTTDAGATWQRLDVDGIAAGRCKSGLSFVDPMHGFLAASDTQHPPVVYRTADGGHTWTASPPMPEPPGLASQPYRFSRLGLVRPFGSTLLVESGPHVYRSTDGGATWGYLASSSLNAVSIGFVTSTRWLQLIVPGQSQETLDAGASWHAYPSDYSQAAPITPDVVFADSQVGYATVRGVLQRTLDGGLHWTMIRTPGTSP